MTTPDAFYGFEDLQNGLTARKVEDFQSHVSGILTARDLLVDQQTDALADAAFKTLPYLPVSVGAMGALQSGVLSLLSEGPRPFHPRYVAPDYAHLLRSGSAFLGLKPASTLYEAVTSLLTAYHYVPNGQPVFIGRLDELLEPYVVQVDKEQAAALLRSFWLLVDRLYPSAFVHANLGPAATSTGWMLLQIERELKTITNLTLRYDEHLTERAFALQAVENALQLAKPYFLNHSRMTADWGEDYVIASCYNAMLLGGGIYTLVRLNLKQLALEHEVSLSVFLDELLPQAAVWLCEVIDTRIRFLVEQVGWFEKDIFIKEDLLHKDRFTAYAGVYGLAEAVAILMARAGMPEARYGHHPEANAAATQITRRLAEEISTLQLPYCSATGGVASFHAQVGIASDQGITPGCRVPAGDEPDLYAHLLAEAPQQEAIPGGISTILEFDQTAGRNPQGVLDIVHGAFQAGVRNLSIGGCDSEFVRVTGYLIRRADLEAKREEKALRHDSSLLGTQFVAHQQNTLHRRVRKV